MLSFVDPGNGVRLRQAMEKEGTGPLPKVEAAVAAAAIGRGMGWLGGGAGAPPVSVAASTCLDNSLLLCTYSMFVFYLCFLCR